MDHCLKVKIKDGFKVNGITITRKYKVEHIIFSWEFSEFDDWFNEVRNKTEWFMLEKYTSDNHIDYRLHCTSAFILKGIVAQGEDEEGIKYNNDISDTDIGKKLIEELKNNFEQ